MASPPTWSDEGGYWVLEAQQQTSDWYQSRFFRLTASKFGAAVGHSEFATPAEALSEILGDKVERSAEAIAAMEHGTRFESVARDKYIALMEGRGTPVAVREIGLAVPKWEPLIGGSPDGLVGADGAIEIKCPKRLYAAIAEYDKRVAAGWRPPPLYHGHVFPAYYDQMQGCMAILGRSWCDYVVYCTAAGKPDHLHVSRIPFNRPYWERELYPAIRRFLSSLLLPALRERGILPAGEPAAGEPAAGEPAAGGAKTDVSLSEPEPEAGSGAAGAAKKRGPKPGDEN